MIIFLWIVDFGTLLTKEVDFDLDDKNAVQDIVSSLNCPISKEEMLLAFWKLKIEKAAGPCDTAVKFTVQLLTLCWVEVNSITGWV